MMSTRTKPRPAHRETPTQALRRQLDEAEARLAQRPDVAKVEELTKDNTRLDATVQALAAQLATVSEHYFPVDGANRILAKLNASTGLWAVLDDTLLAARFWGLDHTWHSTSGAVAEAMFPWSESDACRIGRLLAGQALLASEALPPTVADTSAPVVQPEVVSLAERGRPAQPAADGLQQAKALAEATVNRVLSGGATTVEEQLAAGADLSTAIAEGGPDVTAHALGLVRDAWAATRNHVPAPADVPGFMPEPPDPVEAETVLTPRSAAISANAEQETVALPKARVQGPEQTQVMPAVPIPPGAPPMPTMPPPPVPPLYAAFPPITWGVGHIATTVSGRSFPVRFARAGGAL